MQFAMTAESEEFLGSSIPGFGKEAKVVAHLPGASPRHYRQYL
jgi:hypothetical protein